MSPQVITSAAEVTAAWLTAALEHGGVARGARVVGFTSEPVGTGQMGENVRYVLEWDRAGDRPASVVAKFASDDPTSRATATGGGSYAREVRFYREIASTVDIRTPACHFAGLEDATGLFVLVMEDLAPAVQGDQLAGCSPDDAALVLEQLVALQVPRWNDERLSTVEWLGRRRAGETGTASLYAMVLDGFMERLGCRLDDDAQRLVVDFAGRIGAWVAQTPADHRVVTHGDFRLDNMLFGPIGPGSTRVAVVDWQTPGHGHPATDLSYFLGAGLLPDDRRRHERELVGDYHRRLVDAGVTTWSWDECWTAYRRESFAGIVMAVVASQIVVQTPRGDEMFLAMASRHATQALDHDALALVGET